MAVKTKKPDVPLSRTQLLHARLEEINKDAKKKNPTRKHGLAYTMAGNEELLDLGLIPTGNLAFDYAVGGGLARGGVSMFCGENGSGKTCFALETIANSQRRDPEFLAMYVHTESGEFPLQSARRAGVDEERTIRLEVERTGENIFDRMLELLMDKERKGHLDLLDLIVVDSIAAVVPEAELNAVEKDGYGKQTVGRQAALWSSIFRKLLGISGLGRVHLLLINQIRKEVQYGSTVFPGGQAVLFYPKIITRFNKSIPDNLKVGTGAEQQVLGHRLDVTVLKNNTGRGKPMAKVGWDIYYDQGPDTFKILAETAIKAGLILKEGTASYSFDYEGETLKAYGMPKLKEIVAGNAAIQQYLYNATQQKIIEMGNRRQQETPAVETEEEVEVPVEMEEGVSEEAFGE